MTVRVSQRPRRARQSIGPATGAPPSTTVVRASSTRSAGMASTPLAQDGGYAQREQPVESDRDEQQEAVDRLLPELVDLEDHQRGADAGQQQRAQRRAVDAARAAEDGHAAYDDGRHHDELLAGAGVGVQRAEAGGVDDAGQAGERAADHERAEHAAGDP